MLISTPSIMHTGTHLVKHHIFKGWCELEEGADTTRKNYQVGVHLSDNGMSILRKYFELDIPIVCPMRHPARVLESFKRRGRPMLPEEEMECSFHSLPEHVKEMIRCAPEHKMPGASFHQQWANMVEVYEKYNVKFIHIDDYLMRDEQLREVSNWLGVGLTCDWPLSRDSGAVAGTHNLEVTKEMEDDLPPWIMDFYNKIRG